MKSTPSDLNEEQLSALKALHGGSVAVLAGPGSGKTHTLTAAVRDTLQRHQSARVLCLTFTNKAADSLRAKLPAQSHLFVGTFHALAAQLLQSSRSMRSIADAETLLVVLSELTHHQDLNARELGLIISRYKNGALDSAAAQQLTHLYDKELAVRGLIDYDDLILQALEQATHMEPYSYIFVDEFQDTSPKQYELLHRLWGPTTRLFVIGDPQQSIYRFRGADGSVFDRLRTDCPARYITLHCNYRSAEAIVHVAAQIFPNTSAQQAMRHTAGLARSVQTLDEYSEADYVAHAIEQALGGTEWQHTHHDRPQLSADAFHDFAVLYRTRRQGELLARKLRAKGLPVQCLGEDSPYLAPLAQVIKAAMAYVLEPSVATYAAVKRTATLAKSPIKPAQLDDLRTDDPPIELLQAIAAQLDKSTDEIVLQLENLAASFSQISSFLQHLNTLAEQAFFDTMADAICLSTIHSSKGLEFRHVFVAGCSEGWLPSVRAELTEELNEEQRLFYVATTRACDSLTLLHARRYAGRQATASRFLDSLGLPLEMDSNVEAIKRVRARRRQKRAQQKLL